MNITQSKEEEILLRLTQAVRDADKDFETVGGSSRHWVIDCLLPNLKKQGIELSLVDFPSFTLRDVSQSLER